MKFQTRKIIGIFLLSLMIVFQTMSLIYCIDVLRNTPYLIGMIILGSLILTYFIYGLIIVIYEEEEKEDSVEELITDLKEIEESDNPNDYNPLNTL